MVQPLPAITPDAGNVQETHHGDRAYAAPWEGVTNKTSEDDMDPHDSMLRKETILKHFGPAPKRAELKQWCDDNDFNVFIPGEDQPLELTDQILPFALRYAKNKWPDADLMDICSYAGYVAYLGTGFYGGFGTEEYPKERRAERIITAYRKGTPAAPGEMIGTVTEETFRPTEEQTKRAMVFLDEFYFSNEEKAVAELIENLDERTQAGIMLALADTSTQYEQVLKLANSFLKRKATIGELRTAVKAAMKMLD